MLESVWWAIWIPIGAFIGYVGAGFFTIWCQDRKKSKDPRPLRDRIIEVVDVMGRATPGEIVRGLDQEPFSRVLHELISMQKEVVLRAQWGYNAQGMKFRYYSRPEDVQE